MQLMVKAARLQRPIARTSCWPDPMEMFSALLSLTAILYHKSRFARAVAGLVTLDQITNALTFAVECPQQKYA